MSTASAEKTMYEQIGGQPAVEAAVDLFYRKVLTDDRVSRFFDDVDMDRQSAKQKAFLTMVFGGPANYTGLDMRRGHLHLIARGMDDSHVDAVIELLGETLAELGVPAELIGKVAAVAESVRDDVLDRPAGSAKGTRPGSSNTAAEKQGGCGSGSCGCGKN
ncbi:MAG TPA: group 1 truncated hemoglobin [Tepidisphaeraceae bacterium]|nr:group 1 truncated hemoglobin [Tepidisphaeraceae bacterium]